jgi:hypothetical protein
VSRSLVSLVNIRFHESMFSGSQVVTRRQNETRTYIIETSVGNALRIVFRPQNMEEILCEDVLMFQTLCVVFGRSRNTPRLLTSLLLVTFLLKNAWNLFHSNVLTSLPTRSYLI